MHARFRPGVVLFSQVLSHVGLVSALVMLKRLIQLFGRHAAAEPDNGIEELDRHAPLNKPHGRHAEEAPRTTALLCREALLGRDQRIAGYRFVLRESTRNRIRSSSRIVHHVYAEVLTGSLVQADVPRLLGHRSAVVSLPDSFLEHDSVKQLPASKTVLVLDHIASEPMHEPEALLPRLRALRLAGYRIGLNACRAEEVPPFLRSETDLIVIDSQRSEPDKVRHLFDTLKQQAPQISVLVLNLDSLDDFRFFHALGASWFHGPFITRREDWKARQIDAESVNARKLLDALRSDAASEHIVTLLKQSPAIALQMLRYGNSAANASGRQVRSIEDALQHVGRSRLTRWVMMALLAREAVGGRAAAALEAALIRARMMELLGKSQNADGEALFIVGLLSLIDVVMQSDLRSALDALAIDGDLRCAVLDGSGPYAPLLDLAIAWEEGRTEHIGPLAAACGVSTEAAAEAYMQALWWALDVNP